MDRLRPSDVLTGPTPRRADQQVLKVHEPQPAQAIDIDRHGRKLPAARDRGYSPLMRYISTRGQAPVRDFAGVLLAGLAEDGGLYVPETWPHFSAADLRALRGLPYAGARRARHRSRSSATPSRSRRCRRSAATPMPASATRPIVPLVQLEDRPVGRRSCSTARPSPSRTWPCSCSAGCSTTCWPSGASGSPSSAPPPAIPARRRSRPARGRERHRHRHPASRTAAPARCSAGR